LEDALPTKRRRVTRNRQADLSGRLELFGYGDGTWSYFIGEPVFSSRRAAARAWPGVRREVWALERIGDIPQAAIVFDGFSREGFERFWSGWQRREFPRDEVLKALASDRAAVAAFRRRDPSAAREIWDFLDRWLVCIATWEDAARVAGAYTSPRQWRGTYGETETQ
jgi:hypothetical protein